MSVVYYIIIVVATFIVAYGIVATAVVFRALRNRQDLEYRRKYESSLLQRHRVEEHLKQSRESQTGTQKMTPKNVIRDFIYVDVERLYSLYSQVFEGVADQIVQSYMDALSSADTQILKQATERGISIEAQVAEMSRRTESKFLYDHMYNLFEASVADLIIKPATVPADELPEVLHQTFLIKVTGAAEIEDYTRLKALMEKFNTIGEAIAYAGIGTDESVDEAVHQIEDQIEGIRDRNLKAKAKDRVGRHLDKATLAKLRAKEMGLYQDEQTVKNLNLFSEMFYPDGYDVTIVAGGMAGEMAFRGVLDKRWLRIQPNLLKALYGGYVESKWTMVGQVTYFPGVKLPVTESGGTPADSNDESPSMRDPYRNMFRASRVVERMFLESKSRIDVIICPLAIYREIALTKQAG